MASTSAATLDSRGRRCLLTLPCLLVGGTEVATLQLGRALVGEGCEVGVLVYHEQDEGMVARYRGEGMRVECLGLRRGGGVGLVRLGLRLRREFRTRRPDLVQVQYMAPGLIPILAARAAGVRSLVATVHQPGRVYGWKAHRLLRLGARLCRKFVCVSESVERSWFGSSGIYDPDQAASHRSRHCTIHNAVDVDRVATLADSTDVVAHRQQWDGDPSHFFVGTVSRLRHEKGIDLLLRGFAAFAREEPQARLIIAGEGPDQRFLRELGRELGLSGRVAWLGAQPWDKAMRTLAALDVVVVPSRFEGFGLTAAEAMACGKPVIATRTDGLVEVVGTDHAAGWLVSPDNPTLLASALRGLREDPERRRSMGRTARQRVAERFGFPRFQRQVAALSAWAAAR